MIATTDSIENDENVSRDDLEKFDGIDFSPEELKRMKAMMSVGSNRQGKKYVTKAKKASRNKMQKASRKRNRK